MRGRLGPLLLGAHSIVAAVDDEPVDAILYIGRQVRGTEEPLGVGLILGEEQRGGALTRQEPLAKVWMRSGDQTASSLP